ncbi:MAG: hypothetical protein IPM29_15360 [Planctomycetes bacterium]|nr:hypothetical protein [Planctomycetota bacterium]
MASPTGADGRERRKRKRTKKPKPAESRRAGAAEPRPPRGESREGDGQRAARAAVRALSEMASTLLDAEGIEAFGRPRWLEIRLRVPLDASRDGARCAQDAIRQVVDRVREVREHEEALRPGSVYSFFARSADGPGSRPSSPREVFEGFGSTGRPSFTDFVTLAIERRDAGIDALCEGEDTVVTHVSMGRVLRTQQLQEFGATDPVFRILGQVDAGLFPLVSSDQKAAFSFQLLRGTTLDGTPRFRLHWVGAAELSDIADPGIPQILKRFQQRLDRESLRLAGVNANGGAPDEEEFVLPLLQDLAKRLAGRARRASNRTEHARERTEEGQRPTTKAWEDARDASDDRILRDEAQDTIVVTGPKNRVHVFTLDAKHVTSFVQTGRNVHKRLQEGRWHPAEPEERGEFRLALRMRLREQHDADGGEGGDPAGS